MHDRREFYKEKIENVVGEKAFYRMERVYEKVMRLFGVSMDMPFHVRIAFILHNRMKKKGRKNVLKIEEGWCRRNFFLMGGDHNMISIAKGSTVKNVSFEISGSYNSITIGNNVLLRDAVIHLGDNGNSFNIGDGTETGKGLHVSVLEGGEVSIGNDCMFSTNTSIMNSDAHSIIDVSAETRINKAENVVIGDHVWFGQDVTVLKGATISDNVVIGNKSLLTKGIYKKDSVYAGSPARFLKGGGAMAS